MAQRSDDEFERLFAARRGKLVRLATTLLGDRDDAETVVQATLVAVWEAHRAGALLEPERYAARAVRMNALRWRARRREHVPLETVDAFEMGAFREPAHEIHAWELERAIAGLPPEQQVALRLRYYGGLSFKEIGRALSISINTAASRCRYAVQALKEVFQGDRT